MFIVFVLLIPERCNLIFAALLLLVQLNDYNMTVMFCLFVMLEGDMEHFYTHGSSDS